MTPPIQNFISFSFHQVHQLKYLSTMASSGPDLKKYMGKMVGLKLNNNRQVQGTLAGYDQFMNLVVDDAVQVISSSEQRKLGQIVVRGNSVIRLEHLGKKWAQAEAAKQ